MQMDSPHGAQPMPSQSEIMSIMDALDQEDDQDEELSRKRKLVDPLRTMCECGMVVRTNNLSRHRKAEVHDSLLRRKTRDRDKHDVSSDDEMPLLAPVFAMDCVQAVSSDDVPHVDANFDDVPSGDDVPHVDANFAPNAANNVAPDVAAALNVIPDVAADPNVAPNEDAYKNYKYKDFEQTHPKTFPFNTHSEFLLYCWLCSGPAPSQPMIDSLLLLIRDPDFKKEELAKTQARSFVDAIDKKLPLLDVAQQEEVQQKIRVEGQKKKVLTSRTVPYIKPSDIVREFMATPGLRKHLSLGHDDVGDGPVRAFNQIPFHKESFKWMYSRSLYHKNVEYSIGDSVEFDNGEKMYIEAL
jgi:hypothetical protein